MDGISGVTADSINDHADSSLYTEERDRRFDCSRLPASEAAHQFVIEVVSNLNGLESRQRARRVADQERYVASVTALALDLIHREMTKPGGWIAVSMDKTEYKPETRKAPFLTEAFLQLVTQMHLGGLVDLRKGEQGAFGTGRRTTVRAAPWLISRMKAFDVSLGDIKSNPKLRGDSLVLRSPKVRGRSRDLKVPESDATAKMRSEMTLINDWIADADLGWAWYEDESPIDLGQRFLRRIFNGSLELGGRLYGGFWQGIKSEIRLEGLCFGEDFAVALDFGQMAIRSAYTRVGTQPPEGDLYEVPGFERYRYGIKLVLNALLSARQMPSRFPVGTRGDIPAKYSFDEVLQAIELRHSAIAPLFGAGISLELMRCESDLLVAILLRLREQGVVALPIHDCLLVGDGNKDITRRTMAVTFKEMLGSESSIAVYSADIFSTPSVAPDAPHKKGA